ncbi:MAG: hypothetical protein ACLFWD_11835 [Anaerolineales bacterium]
MKATTQSRRLILAILAVLVGLFMVAAAPLLIQISVERVIAALVEVAKTKPQFASGITLFTLAYPLYRAFIFVGGIALILLARPIYQGEEWTFPAGLLASAFPAAGGMFMFLPYVSWVEGFPVPTVISIVGLLFFWSFILIRNVDKWLKIGQLISLTFAGMLTTHAFTIGVGNLRMLMTRPHKPLFGSVDWWVLSWSGPVQWLSVVLLFIAIHQIAARKILGWRLGILAGTSILAINIPTQIIRSFVAGADSLDYLYGALLAAGLLIGLLYPRFKDALLADQRAQR